MNTIKTYKMTSEQLWDLTWTEMMNISISELDKAIRTTRRQVRSRAEKIFDLNDRFEIRPSLKLKEEIQRSENLIKPFTNKLHALLSISEEINSPFPTRLT